MFFFFSPPLLYNTYINSVLLLGLQSLFTVCLLQEKTKTKNKKTGWPLFWKIIIHKEKLIYSKFVNIIIFLINTLFWSSIKFTEKLRGEVREFSCTSCSHTFIASPFVNFPHNSGIFVTIDKLHQQIRITPNP